MLKQVGFQRGPLLVVFWLLLGIVWALPDVMAQEPEAAFDWSTSEEWLPGVNYAAFEQQYPNAEGLTCPSYLFFQPQNQRRLKMHALRIDLQTPKLKFVVTGRAENWGEPMPNFRDEVLSEFVVRTKRQTTRDFAREQRKNGIPVVLAINASPWSPFQSGVSHPFADRMGLTISNGEVVCPSDGRPSFIVDKTGAVDLQVVSADSNTDHIMVAVSGFSFCLTEGQVCEEDTVLHPRTGLGLSRDKRFLIVVLCDGRQAASHGATVHELGGWLKHFGAHNGLNMDGGGSTTLVRWQDAAQEALLVNRPAHGERANGSNLGVYILPE
ncbi:MAG: phosphodiester glycosidase family protein [Planctomycetaceae bacterium]|nr:phosphodiester glycosidase family protein [Planctomycetaceae bacterium]